MRDDTGEPAGRRHWRRLAWLALADAARAAATLALALALLGALLAPVSREAGAALRVGLPLSLAPAAWTAPFWGLLSRAP